MEKLVKVLDGFQPFNDFFYFTCFYNSVAPVLKKYGVPISAIFANAQYYYVLEKKEISVKYLLNKDLVSLFAEHGINIKVQKGHIDLKTFIIEEINKGDPVIAFVDLFYLSHREDGYQKLHAAHSLLIYGYELENNLFQVIEHFESNTLDFSEIQVNMDDIVTAHNAYVNHIDDFGFVACSFKGESAKYKLEKEESFLEAYFKFQKVLYEQRKMGIELLEEYSNQFEKTILKQSELDSRIQQLIINFQFVLKAKKGELELLELMKADKGKIKRSEELFTHWAQINNSLQYYLVSGRYKNKSMIKLVQYMKDICQIEQCDILF